MRKILTGAKLLLMSIYENILAMNTLKYGNFLARNKFKFGN